MTTADDFSSRQHKHTPDSKQYLAYTLCKKSRGGGGIVAAGAAWRLHTEETHETVHEDVAHHGVERVRGHRARRQQISRPRLVHTLRKQSSGGVESITTGTGGEQQLQYLKKEMMAVRWEKQKSSKASQSQTRKKQNLGKSWFFTG